MSFARNTAVIGGLTLVSRVFGFARDLVIAAALGAGPVSDAFVAAQRLPNIFRRLFAEGAFSQAFVPVYSKMLAEHGAERADRMASEALAAIIAATGLVTAIAVLCMPWINGLLLLGYADDPETFALATLLTQITMPYLVAISMATLFAGVLNARGRFVAAAAAPILLNLCLLLALSPVIVRLAAPEVAMLRGLAAMLPRWTPEDAAFVAAIAVTVSGVLQASWVYFGARKDGWTGRFQLPKLTDDVKRIAALAAPGALAGGALQINTLTSSVMASFEEGAMTFLATADRLYQLPLGLIGIAVGVAMLPRLSRLVHEKDQAGAKAAMDEAVALSMAFTLPAAAAILAIPFFLIDALFTRGAFDEADARATAQALFHFGWGVPAFVLARIYAPAFFARENTVAPMRFALISMGLNIAVGAALFFGLRALGMPGFPGLAAATSFAAWANVALMVRALSREGSYGPTPSALWRLSRIGLSAGLLFAFLALAGTQRFTLEAIFGGKELALLVTVAVGAALYFVSLFVLRAVSVREIRAAFRKEKGAPAASAGLPGGFDG